MKRAQGVNPPPHPPPGLLYGLASWHMEAATHARTVWYMCGADKRRILHGRRPAMHTCGALCWRHPGCRCACHAGQWGVALPQPQLLHQLPVGGPREGLLPSRQRSDLQWGCGFWGCRWWPCWAASLQTQDPAMSLQPPECSQALPEANRACSLHHLEAEVLQHTMRDGPCRPSALPGESPQGGQLPGFSERVRTEVCALPRPARPRRCLVRPTAADNVRTVHAHHSWADEAPAAAPAPGLRGPGWLVLRLRRANMLCRGGRGASSRGDAEADKEWRWVGGALGPSCASMPRSADLGRGWRVISSPSPGSCTLCRRSQVSRGPGCGAWCLIGQPMQLDGCCWPACGGGGPAG